MLESFKVGETYTVTIKGRKPAKKKFGVYNAGTVFLGLLTPVEGLSDVWTGTFTVSLINSLYPNRLQIYQLVNDNQNGEVQIDWLKIEKGDTRTPNIDHLRYKGIGVTKNSINKYLWKENTLLENVYINSIDFGDYDYSGNPNLMKNVDSNSWSNWISGYTQPKPYVKIFDDYIIMDATDPSAANVGRNAYVPRLTQLQAGKKYTMSVTMMVDEEFNSGGDISYNGSAVHFTIRADGKDVRPNIIRPKATMVNQYQRVSVTFTMPTDITNVEYTYFHVYESQNVTGKWYIKNDIKIEGGSTATPYQPNLLDAPYYLSKLPLGENLVKNAQFPITTSNNPISGFDILEELTIGETYTVSLKGTKPANKEFHLYYGDAANYQATLRPVEGLTDVWGATFKAGNATGTSNLLRVALWQKPNSVADGAVQIEWLKIEKGDTRTPNISDYKYIGEKSIYSNDYQNINWDVTKDYIDNKFNIMVDTVNPQAIGGTKNFLETPFVNNSPIVYDENPLPFEAWYSQAKEVRPCSHKSRLPIGRELTNIGKTRRRLMKDNPLQWNSGQWEAQVLRDCILLIEGTVILEFGSNSGIWTYIDVWNDTAQTKIIGEGAGTGVGDPSKLWFRNEVAFSRYVALSKGTQLSIGTSMPEGKQLTKAVMRSMHIMEIDIE